jgi:hypothetical protein
MSNSCCRSHFGLQAAQQLAAPEFFANSVMHAPLVVNGGIILKYISWYMRLVLGSSGSARNRDLLRAFVNTVMNFRVA